MLTSRHWWLSVRRATIHHAYATNYSCTVGVPKFCPISQTSNSSVHLFDTSHESCTCLALWCAVMWFTTDHFHHIHQGYFLGIGAIVRLSTSQWRNLEEYGKWITWICETQNHKPTVFIGLILNQKLLQMCFHWIIYSCYVLSYS